MPETALLIGPRPHLPQDTTLHYMLRTAMLTLGIRLRKNSAPRLRLGNSGVSSHML